MLHRIVEALSQNSCGRCYTVVDALSGALAETKPVAGGWDLDALFLAQYPRVARIIQRVIRDPGRAEELAVDVFLKWARARKAGAGNAEPWLYRTAVRMALNELRRQARQNRYEGLMGLFRKSPATPEELHVVREEQERVRLLLHSMNRRQAELLVLRSQGLRYDELAAALKMNPASVGTLLSRAQKAFRKEYVERYGNE